MWEWLQKILFPKGKKTKNKKDKKDKKVVVNNGSSFKCY